MLRPTRCRAITNADGDRTNQATAWARLADFVTTLSPQQTSNLEGKSPPKSVITRGGDRASGNRAATPRMASQVAPRDHVRLCNEEGLARKREGAIGRVPAVERQPFRKRSVRVQNRNVSLSVDRAVETAVVAPAHPVRPAEVVAFEGLQDIAEDFALWVRRPRRRRTDRRRR